MSKEFEDLLGQYWDLAHLEGKSGVSQGDKANEVLHALKKLAEQPATPFGIGGGLVAIKTLLSRDPCAHAKVAIEMIDAMLAARPAQQQEPVAWITQGGKGWLRWHNKNDDHLNKTSVPLYKHPKRKPLSDAEIALISAECSLRTPSDIYFARAIEAAHGITGKQK